MTTDASLDTIGLPGSVRLRWANAHYTWVSFKLQHFPSLQKYLYIFRRNWKRKMYIKKYFIHLSSKFPGTPTKNVNLYIFFVSSADEKFINCEKSIFIHFRSLYIFRCIKAVSYAIETARNTREKVLQYEKIYTEPQK